MSTYCRLCCDKVEELVSIFENNQLPWQDENNYSEIIKETLNIQVVNKHSY